MKHILRFLLGSACLVSMAASAQWQWTDKEGRQVFSDRAPPASIPEKNIQKRPAVRTVAAGLNPGTATIDTSAVAAAPAPQKSASAPKASGIDKDLAERKKQADEENAAKRKADEEKALKAKVENCARAKQGKAGLESGMRLTRINEKGEREVLDDLARAAELRRIQAIIEIDCKG